MSITYIVAIAAMCFLIIVGVLLYGIARVCEKIDDVYSAIKTNNIFPSASRETKYLRILGELQEIRKAVQQRNDTPKDETYETKFKKCTLELYAKGFITQKECEELLKGENK